jgi:fatty-acyl-CoA synthase
LSGGGHRGKPLHMSLADLDTPLPGTAKANPAAGAWLRALAATAPIASHPSRILPALIDDLADIHLDAPALLSDRECLTFRELAERSNRYARWALAQGVAKGDVICLMMPNRPDYMAIWLGLTRIGGIVALINTNLSGSSLAHCIEIVNPKHIIVAASLLDALDSARPHLQLQAKISLHGGGGRFVPRIDHRIASYSGSRLAAEELRNVTTADRALLIYTSGTTGLPKAAHVSHHRLMAWSAWFGGMMDTRTTDRMYNCLPMYHSVGGIVATGAVLINGGSVFIRDRFSARQFWDDVTRWGCTLFQYIGELCRYLVNADPHPREREHRIRLCCGNGLQPDIWPAFKSRFQIPHILEFYAATEGNFSLYNAEGEPGAIGRVPPFLAHRFPAALVRFDPDRSEPIRDTKGFCIRCAPNEIGEAIGRIPSASSALSGQFEGYTSPHETERKILRNVFEAKDAWFRTGDLMRKDERGFFYFVDRIGDTFRWKGENVATSEVAHAMTDYPGLVEATVYGVAVPGADGRAGMAAVVTDERFALPGLRAHLSHRLPDYALPVFLRIRRALDVTPTFKQKKGELAQEGYDPAVIGEAIYFNDPDQTDFVPLDAALHARIQSGAKRL